MGLAAASHLGSSYPQTHLLSPELGAGQRHCPARFSELADQPSIGSGDPPVQTNLELGWEERQIGGLGVFFVKELMDKITYTRENENTNLMVLEKNISKSQ